MSSNAQFPSDARPELPEPSLATYARETDCSQVLPPIESWKSLEKSPSPSFRRSSHNRIYMQHRPVHKKRGFRGGGFVDPDGFVSRRRKWVRSSRYNERSSLIMVGRSWIFDLLLLVE
ncbi:unnamed protein product [Linum trigynum]|uniref:Uncharacterized protein n=1 Tax=Linum trigynum TaxID=586398 RepID=A0AAV2DC57_9ROSI